MLDWLTHRALLAWRRVQGKPFVTRAAAARLPTEYGEFDIVAYEDSVDRKTHVALVHGDLGSGENVLARVHSSCVTGDIFHSARCDCGPQSHRAEWKMSPVTQDECTRASTFSPLPRSPCTSAT